MIYHIVVGDEAAKPLLEAVLAEPSMAGEVLVMKDILNVGPLQKGDGQSFSALRSEWWNVVVPNEKTPIVVDDLERLLEISTELYKDLDAIVWFWMAPLPADVAAYHWMLPYLARHVGRFSLVNIANLPFLDAEGKVFYPRSLAHILPRELIKARRLARAVTPAELEMDGDNWKQLVAENTGVRSHEGGKKLASREANYYDDRLMAHCTASFSKASRVLGAALAKDLIPTGDSFLAWRLRELAAQRTLDLQGDTAKTFRDWEIRLAQVEALAPGD